ncbi:pleckstrin homology domain-containing family F member 2-like [Xenia sp. Carnegie-2017]|uniref:pleckstrin homology domain-containing family F member 2-like n=1 Tax=Xenia sp. Carnegie-2017 TaxID=2897299 RepID=UPI001F04E0DB|nr:pleckstrin homology domain-containing family F member 2-like [Xenia sp. Carnegie-2017]
MVDRLVNSEANARRINNVEKCFGASGQPLAIHGRVLVGEGVLTKLCRKKPKPRQFFLFNDILVYGNIVINKKKYNKQHTLPLEGVQLLAIEDDEVLKHGWQIISQKKSFAVYAATATEKAEWMAHINKCITDLLSKTGKQPSTEHAAVWIPDNEASLCMLCRKTKFTTLNRRHHCRKCGGVVCGDCSTKRFLLPQQSSKPLRVCDKCYSELTNEVNSRDIVKSSNKEKRPTRPPPPKATANKKEQHRVDSGSSGEESDDDGDQTDDLEVETQPTFYKENGQQDINGKMDEEEVSI